MSASSASRGAAAAAPASLTQILSGFLTEYSRTASTTVRIVDGFLVYALFTGLVQFAYCALVGTFPFNSFLSGFISTVGVFVLTGVCALQCVMDSYLPSAMSHVMQIVLVHLAAASLRLQLTDTKEFKDRSPYLAFAEYLLCCIVLFLAVLNFLG